MLGCVLLSSVVIGGAGIRNAKRVVDEDSVRIMNLMCSEKAQSINTILIRVEQSVNMLAGYALEQLDDVERLMEDDLYVDLYTKRVRDLAINAAKNTEGALGVYLRFNPEFTDPTSGLFWSKTGVDSSFQEIEPTDFSKFRPDDLGHVGWYYIPVQNGKPTWMAPYINKNIDIEMISYVIPLYVDNVTVGVVGMDIDFNLLKGITDGITVYDTGYAFLTDTKANVMYHNEIQSGTSIGDVNSSLRILSDEFSNPTSECILYPYSWKGEAKKMTFSSLVNGMRLVITAPAREIDAAKNKLVLQNVVALAFISTVSVILAMVMSRRIIQPLKELNVAAQKIAAGDLAINLTCRTEDEVGALAASFQKTVDHLRKYIEYINGLAYRDGLTGVKNKTAYQETVKRLDHQMQVGKPQFAVAVFDVNGLKEVNDTYGHDFGDMVITDACRIICKVFKRSPVYRIGGDEFVAILENADYENREALMRQFKGSVEAFNQYAHASGRFSVAGGLSAYDADIDLAFKDVFQRADEAMYQNKADMKQSDSRPE